MDLDGSFECEVVQCGFVVQGGMRLVVLGCSV